MIRKKEGHYTIKQVAELPEKPNLNYVYILEGNSISKLYFPESNGSYSEASLGSPVSLAAYQETGSAATDDLVIRIGDINNEGDNKKPPTLITLNDADFEIEFFGDIRLNENLILKRNVGGTDQEYTFPAEGGEFTTSSAKVTFAPNLQGNGSSFSATGFSATSYITGEKVFVDITFTNVNSDGTGSPYIQITGFPEAASNFTSGSLVAINAGTNVGCYVQSTSIRFPDQVLTGDTVLLSISYFKGGVGS